MALPSNFTSLSVGEQLFVLTDIERVDRGLPPVVGMVQELNQDAQAAAAGNADPTPSSVPPGSTAFGLGLQFGPRARAPGSNYNWMYDDGPGSGDLGCTSSNSGSCWGHRDNELGFDSSQVAASHGVLVMGAAEATVPGDAPWSSDAELIALVSGSPAFTYTWAQAQAAGRARALAGPVQAPVGPRGSGVAQVGSVGLRPGNRAGRGAVNGEVTGEDGARWCPCPVADRRPGARRYRQRDLEQI